MRKHLRRPPAGPGRSAEAGHVFTEFINRAEPVSSALGHHLMEGRWLREGRYHDDYVLWWLRSNGGRPHARLHHYSQWLADALYRRYLVTHDRAFVVGLLDDLIADYRQWEAEKQRPDGLFWQFDVRDAMEESISGSRKEKHVRPTINSYMYGNAQAIAAIARLAGRPEVAAGFAAQATTLRRLTLETLWNRDSRFFEVRREDGALARVREAIGFIPWYFGLPEPGRGYEEAWAQIRNEQGFRAPLGLTTAERRHPEFRSHGVGTCEWDGAVWPFATSQTLTALANVLRDYPQQSVSAADHFDAFRTYVRCHRMNGKPYLGEYLDEKTGAWLKGDHPRSRWYHHSTFADLLIGGVIGLRPRDDDTVEVHPLLPAGTWDWFALDGVRYHGRTLTIVWDRDGRRFGRGAGLTVLADGVELVRAASLTRVTGTLPVR
ncbi:MAG: glycoside hydrolase [Verrucomicrobia bacterium]|nr:glycoside hydrolase [Verrucomicrobiota bacterium]